MGLQIWVTVEVPNVPGIQLFRGHEVGAISKIAGDVFCFSPEHGRAAFLWLQEADKLEAYVASESKALVREYLEPPFTAAVLLILTPSTVMHCTGYMVSSCRKPNSRWRLCHTQPNAARPSSCTTRPCWVGGMFSTAYTCGQVVMQLGGRCPTAGNGKCPHGNLLVVLLVVAPLLTGPALSR